MDAFNLYRFSGRSGRMDFALTQIGVFTSGYLLTFLLIVLTGAGYESVRGVGLWGQTWAMLAGAVIAAHLLWISLAAAVRRCHDRDLSGWMLLFAMPPLLGQLWLVLSLVTGPGTDGPNRHGRRRSTFSASPARPLSDSAAVA